LDLSAAIVAGGLSPSNVVEVVRALRPFGVDTAGGVERAPGRKDPVLVKEFIDNAKSA
jgi:phosphoribosylanthranilate isomerase